MIQNNKIEKNFNKNYKLTSMIKIIINQIKTKIDEVTLYLKCIHHNQNPDYWAGLFFCPQCGTANSLRDTEKLGFEFPIQEFQKEAKNDHILNAPSEIDRRSENELTKKYYVEHNSPIYSNIMLSINVCGDLIFFTTGIDFQPQKINENSGRIYVISLDEFEKRKKENKHQMKSILIHQMTKYQIWKILSKNLTLILNFLIRICFIQLLMCVFIKILYYYEQKMV